MNCESEPEETGGVVKSASPSATGPTVSEQKRALRARLQALRAQWPAEARRAESAAWCARLEGLEIWREAWCVLLFAPLPDEPEVTPLFEAAWAAGKKVGVPRFNTQHLDYEVFEVPNAAALAPGYYGILEPARFCAPLALNLLDLALVPGVAFDVTGRRLGRGKGYFDRLLAQVRGHTCGAAMEWQIVSEVPSEPHDVGLNSLLTPSRWIRCAEPRAVSNDFAGKH